MVRSVPTRGGKGGVGVGVESGYDGDEVMEGGEGCKMKERRSE